MPSPRKKPRRPRESRPASSTGSPAEQPQPHQPDEILPPAATAPIAGSDLAPSGATGLEAAASIPEEDIWLRSHKSERTRRAYKKDVQAFMRFLGVADAAELRAATHASVILWEAHLRETRGYAPSTVRRRLAAVSSLFRHLKAHNLVDNNPAADVRRPPVNRTEGSTPAFSKEEARALLDAPDKETLVGLRDRAVLSVGLHAGLRRAEIAHLAVGDLYVDRGVAALRVLRKGGRKGSLPINAPCEARIRAYLEAAGTSEDPDAPMFLPTTHNRHTLGSPTLLRHVAPDTIDRIVKRYALKLGLAGRYSAHSMRATFITTTLDNGSPLEEVQRAAGHADPGTTKLYDRRGFDPERGASFFANY